MTGAATSQRALDRLRPLAVTLAALAGVTGAMVLVDHATAARPAAPRPRPTDYELAVLRQTRAADFASRFADADPRSFLRRSEQAAELLGQARLTGSDDAFAAAGVAIDQAFAAAHQDMSQLLLLRASLRSSLHRFRDAEQDLARIDVAEAERGEKAGVLGLRSDVDLQLGRTDEARADVEQALQLTRDPANLARLGYLELVTGDLEGALRLYREALQATPESDGRQRAWLLVQRGRALRDRGRLDEARAAYQAADRSFSGWPLVQGHLAEVDALSGRIGPARAAYRDLVARTGDPEHMDALAALLPPRDPEARQLVARAGQRYEAKLARFREAATGHALAHFLNAARDASRALELAQRNREIRPNPESATLLAQATLYAGDPARARETLEPVLASSGWHTAEIHAVAALIYSATGDARRAASEHARALALRPDADEVFDGLGQIAR